MGDSTALGDRMKWYESRFTNDQFMPLAPVIARMDGRAFHTFTKGMERPYDKKFSDLMIETTRLLVQETNARCGYTQSDEITLVWLVEEWGSDIFFAGKLQKMNSLLASMTSTFFNALLSRFMPEKAVKISEWSVKQEGKPPIPQFDCRVFQVPVEYEATNCFIWREQDATRNSIQMAARAYFSHAECDHKDTSALNEMLFQKGINWNDYPAFFKRGTYVRKREIERPFTTEEWNALPEKHHARMNPDLKVKKTVIMKEDFEPLVRMENREEVLLHGADPIYRTSETK